MSKGWIKNRFFKAAALEASVAAEDSDDIVVSLQLVDQNGDSLAESLDFMYTVSDIIFVPALETSYVCTATNNISPVAAPAGTFSLDADGAATLTITDVVGGSDEILNIVLTPINHHGVTNIIEIVFDAI